MYVHVRKGANPTSRKFTYRGGFWSTLTAINEGILYTLNLNSLPRLRHSGGGGNDKLLPPRNKIFVYEQKDTTRNILCVWGHQQETQLGLLSEDRETSHMAQSCEGPL